MSGRAWLLHQATEVAGEPVTGAVYLVRHKPFHWPVVIAVAAVGAWLGTLMPIAPLFFVGAFALIVMGLGMNVRTQWRLVVRGSRLLLVDASPVDARPVRIAAELQPDDVQVVRRRPLWATVTVQGAPHTVARHHVAPLLRMLAAQPAPPSTRSPV